MRSLLWFVAVVIAGCLTACNNAPDKLAVASRVVYERPDSAYALLREIDYNELDHDSLRAHYVLTKAVADLRIGQSLVTDTLLDGAAEYFLRSGDTANWVLATQLLSGYELMQGDPEAGMQRLEALLSKLHSKELIWDTNVHLLELSLNCGAYAKAYIYADRLLKNTDVAAEILKFGAAKGASLYMQGDNDGALAVFDSIIATGAPKDVAKNVAADFYCDYAEILDGAGRSTEAIAIVDGLMENADQSEKNDKVSRLVSLAQFHANNGNLNKASELLDNIDYEAIQPNFEAYAFIGMLKAGIEFKKTGRFPSEFIRRVTKNMQRSYYFTQIDREKAMESVMELADDNYKLRLQRQHMWTGIMGGALVLIIGIAIVYGVMNRRRRLLIEAQERAETLERMMRETARTTPQSDKLRAALLRQLDIFRVFAGTPTQHSRDALKKISSAGKDCKPTESMVDWPEFYAMIDNLYDGFYSRMLKKYPDLFNEKELEIIVLLKADFATKEIGVLTEQTSATIYTRKSAIRKKIGAAEGADLIATLDERIKA